MEKIHFCTGAGVRTYCCDCMELLQQVPDGYYELAVVDPPYGGGADGTISRTGGGWASKYGNNIASWDIPPDADYFRELFRVSKNQIIWGGNYFHLPPSRCFVVWHKTNIPSDFTMSCMELAWTSYNRNAELVEMSSAWKEQRIHPTQKPISLYKWILARFASRGDRLLDTHAGSFSMEIAAYELGMSVDACEIDPAYYARDRARLERAMAQGMLPL